MSNRNERGALAVSRINKPGIHFVSDVPGLAIKVFKSGSRSWFLRYQIGGRRRDKGLGGYPGVTLADAKTAARAARALISQGIDPIEHGRAARSKLIAELVSAISFKQAATKYIETHEGGWKHPKHAQQWRSTIETYANSKLGNMPVRDITVAHILSILEPIWATKTETASRLRGRIEAVLDWATARGYRSGPNPAKWKGLLDTLLPAPGRIAKKDHHPALPYSELSKFMRALAKQEGMGARALEFTILNASRSGEVRGAKWDEFDLEAGVWTVPAIRMKAGKEHRVPLSDAALNLVKTQKAVAFCEYVFPSTQKARNSDAEGSPLSDMTLSAVLRRMGVAAVPHGFRSTFRDWCAEQTDYPRDVAEMALAHAIGNKVEAAYRRGDLFDKRKQMMQDWADFAKSEV